MRQKHPRVRIPSPPPRKESKMIIKALANKEVSFESENTIDGFKLGVLREKCRAKQISLQISLNAKELNFVKIVISDVDLLTIMGIL